MRSLRLAAIFLSVTMCWVAVATARPDGRRTPTFDFTDTHDLTLWIGIALDASGSMRNGRMEIARAEAIATLESIPETSHFALVAFDSTSRSWAPAWRQASQAEVHAATTWLSGFEPSATTNLVGAIESLIAYGEPIRDSMVIVVITDGEPDGNRDAILERLDLICGDVPVFMALVRPPGAGLVFGQELASLTDGQCREVIE